MQKSLTLSRFNKLFPDDDSCLDAVANLQYPKGIHCLSCKKVTTHYKVAGRTAYTCKACRHQVYPLKGTIFEKSSTPLRTWFYCMFLMTHSRGDLSIRQLQRELEVTYKTAWRMYVSFRRLMEQGGGDLLFGTGGEKESRVHKWVFFNKIEFTVVQKQEAKKEA